MAKSTSDSAEHAHVAGIHHLAIRADDVEATAAFYRKIFGLVVVSDQRPRSLWLRLDARCVLMVEAREPGEPPVSDGSMDMFALAVDDETRKRILEYAAAAGCLDGQTEHTVYLRDPDGRRVGASSFPLDP